MNPAELKAMRQSAGLTQVELAEAVGVTRVYVGMMERGVAHIERRMELAVRHVIASTPVGEIPRLRQAMADWRNPNSDMTNRDLIAKFEEILA